MSILVVIVLLIILFLGIFISLSIGYNLEVRYSRIRQVPYRKIKHVTFEPHEVFDGLMTIIYSEEGKLDTYLKRQYYGSSTVWYTFPEMIRANTKTEIELSGYYTYIKKFGNPYPNAHLKIEEVKG